MAYTFNLTPTTAPTTLPPTEAPTTLPPTEAPTTAAPTETPTTAAPTEAPTTLPPTEAPTTLPPTEAPTTLPPTEAPTTAAPTEAPASDVTLPPCPEGLVAYRIMREYGSNPYPSEKMTFYYGLSSEVFLSLTYNGNATEIITGCMKPQLLTLVLEGEDDGWKLDSYYTIESAFGMTGINGLRGYSSTTGYFHNDFGYLTMTEVTSCEEFLALPDTVNMIHVMNNACNDPDIIEFATARFLDLVYLRIGDENFMYVKTFSVQNNTNLQFIHIQDNSFTQVKYYLGNDTSKTFHILNCESLESFQIGEYSFSDYSGGFELENLPQLRSIQMGSQEGKNFNFYFCSFVIRGIELILNI